MTNRRTVLLGLAATPLLAAAAPEEPFWADIETLGKPGVEDHARADALTDRLAARTKAEILAFETSFNTAMARAYRWDLWGAGYVIHGGMSDDGFTYFRCWLVGQGRATFERVLASPDALADIIPDGQTVALELEDLLYVAREAWIRKTGDEPGEGWPIEDVGADPAGERFDEAALESDYPRLWARFSANPLS